MDVEKLVSECSEEERRKLAHLLGRTTPEGSTTDTSDTARSVSANDIANLRALRKGKVVKSGQRKDIDYLGRQKFLKNPVGFDLGRGSALYNQISGDMEGEALKNVLDTALKSEAFQRGTSLDELTAAQKKEFVGLCLASVTSIARNKKKNAHEKDVRDKKKAKAAGQTPEENETGEGVGQGEGDDVQRKAAGVEGGEEAACAAAALAKKKKKKKKKKKRMKEKLEKEKKRMKEKLEKEKLEKEKKDDEKKEKRRKRVPEAVSTANASEPVVPPAVTAEPAAQKPIAASLDKAPVNKPAADRPAGLSAHETILGASIDLRAHKKKPKKRKAADKVDAAQGAAPENEERAPTPRAKAPKKVKKVPKRCPKCNSSALGEYQVKPTDDIACDRCKDAIVSEGFFSREYVNAFGCLDNDDCDYDVCISCYALLE